MNDATQDFDPFAGGGILLSAPTTEAQQEIWLAVEIEGEPANLAYNESVSVRIRGAVNVAALEAAIVTLVKRHEALRTTFGSDGMTLLVEAEPRIKFVVEDLKALDPNAREAKRAALVDAEARKPFDLVRGPLFRPVLVELASDDRELVLTSHHIVCDGWSTGVLLSELPEAYRAAIAGVAPTLEPAPPYSEYALAELKAKGDAEAGDAERYWLEALGKTPPVLDLPTDFPRGTERRFDARRDDFPVERELVDALRAVGKSAGASLVATFLASFDALMYRITGQTEFVIGMPAAGQAASGMEGLVGHCVNTLPIRLGLDPKKPFVDHVRSVKRAILDGAENQRLSFGALLTKLDLPRDPGRIPLIPVLFNIDRKMPNARLGDAESTFISNPRAFEAFEIFLNAAEVDDGMILEMTYGTGLFRPETIRRWVQNLMVLLRGVVAAPETPLGRLPILSDAERAYVTDELNRTTLELPSVSGTLDLFRTQVERAPDAIAVRDDCGALTYRELDRRANHVAHRLRELGVGPEQCVGVCVERGTRLLLALLGVWKAGGSYVPIDPEYPAARNAFVVDDAAVRVLVTERGLANTLAEGNFQRLFVDEETQTRDDAPDQGGGRLAYVLHTSGSTGKPKGVQIEHRSLVNFLVSMAREPGLGADDVLVAVTTLSFDIAGLELYLPLTVGAQVVIASREVAMSGEALTRLLGTSGATVLQATPATWRLLIDANFRGGPKFKALCGGEALPRELAGELLGRVGSLWNMYGPTETTIWSTCARIESIEGPITIGRPIANTTLHILDAEGSPVPLGAVGELHIGGVGVARGYLNRPDLTSERFVPDPFASTPGARLYKTGDLARYDASGRVYFERRNDGQVKVRGFRIELGEIEAVFDQHPSVRQSACVIRQVAANDVRILAYVVSSDGKSPNVAALQQHARDHLAPYMIPQHVIALAEMPLTPNGKVDRKALPAPDLESLAAEQYVAPNTPTQVKLTAIWADVLRLRRVGIRDGFFELGGHSMLAVRMLNRVRETLGVVLPLRVAFQAQTVEALSAHVEAALLVGSRDASAASAGNREEVDF